jgi:hypothetical protein
VTDAEAVAVLDDWASRSYLRWQTYMASENAWYCRLAPAVGNTGSRMFCAESPAAARIKAAETILASRSPVPGWRHHVFCEHYGPEAKAVRP